MGESIMAGFALRGIIDIYPDGPTQDNALRLLPDSGCIGLKPSHRMTDASVG